MPSERFRRSAGRVLALTLVTAASAIGAAGASQAAATVTQATRVPAQASITLRSSEYGKVVADARGRVLYLFAADKGGPTSTCYGACAKAWPPLLTKGAPTAGAGLNAKLGTTKRKDGTLQVTYNKHPLYYFEGDEGRKIMCQHANMHGGFWYVVKANGTANLAKSKTHM